jgi:hypothetical protein
MAKNLVIIGLLIAVIGLLWPWLGRLPWGHLPGDIIIRREGFAFYFPITTMVLVSAVISLLLWLFGR